MEWISVKDRLPNEEDNVILLVKEIEHYGRYNEKRKVYFWIFTGWHIDGEWATTYCHGFRRIKDENETHPNCEHVVTHWMPFPELPNSKTEVENDEEHQVKTILQDFLEKYPNAMLDESGVPKTCPNALGYTKENGCVYDGNCRDCWNRPLEVDKK